MGAKTYSYNLKNPQRHSVKYLNKRVKALGGNYWLAQQEMERYSLYNQRKSGEINSQFDDELEYEFIKREKDYWTDFFVFWDNETNTPHPEMEFAKPFIIDCLYSNSGVGIANGGANRFKPLVYRLTMFYRNSFYELVQASGIIYAYPTAYDASLPNYSLMNRIDLTNGNSALVLSDADATPWGYGIKHWATMYRNNFNAFNINNVNSLNVKLISAQNISENARREIVKMQGGGQPWQIIDGSIDKIYDLGLENKVQYIDMQMNTLEKKYREARGMRYNFDAKSERNIKSEVGKNDATFIVIENKKMRILTELTDKINNLFGTNISVRKTMDIYAEKTARLEAVPEMMVQSVKNDGLVEKQLVANDGKTNEGEIK